MHTADWLRLIGEVLAVIVAFLLSRYAERKAVANRVRRVAGQAGLTVAQRDALVRATKPDRASRKAAPRRIRP